MRISEIINNSTKDISEASLTGKYRPSKTAEEKFRDGVKRAGYDMEAGGKRLQALLDRLAQERIELDKKYAEWDEREKAKSQR